MAAEEVCDIDPPFIEVLKWGYQEFEIEIPDEEGEKIVTAQALIDYVWSHMG